MQVYVKDNSAAVITALNQQLRQGLGQVGQAAVRYAQDEIQKAGRVKTGAMYRSITFQVRKDGVYVGTNDKKAAFHELGTGRFTKVHSGESYGVRAVHFLHHAAAYHKKEYRNILLNAMKGGGGGAA